MRERVRLPQLDLPKPWRVAAMVLLGIVLAALAAWMAAKDDRAVELPATPVATPSADPLVAEMRRCQALGEAGGRDPACLAAWAENRRRFLGVDPRPEAPLDPQAIPAAER
jgi:conjugative transfer region protein TrbK